MYIFVGVYTHRLSDVESPVTSGISGRVDASRVALLVAWVSLIKRTQPLWTGLFHRMFNDTSHRMFDLTCHRTSSNFHGQTVYSNLN